jgi:hypothetical protein
MELSRGSSSLFWGIVFDKRKSVSVSAGVDIASILRTLQTCLYRS